MARAYVYDMVDTWNAGATTFTAIKMNVTDTASAAASLLIDLQVGGVSEFKIRKDGLTTVGGFMNTAGFRSTSDGGFYITDSTSPGAGGNDIALVRDAANTLAQRNGTAAQVFRIYNTYTDISNNIYLGVRWSGVDMRIQTSHNGSGTSTPSTLTFGTNGTEAWRITTANHLTAVTDNTYDIGASGANRPRNIYAAGLADIRGSLYVGGAVEFIGVSAGVVTLREFATSAFNRLQFGGTSSAFPALKRSGAEIHVRLADDSNYANFTAQGIDASTTLRALARVHAFYATAIPAGGTTGAGLHVSSTSNFGVFFGSGAPTLSAAKGSLYLRSDGTTTNDRMYVNTDGATTWTAVTTAA